MEFKNRLQFFYTISYILTFLVLTNNPYNIEVYILYAIVINGYSVICGSRKSTEGKLQACSFLITAGWKASVKY